MSEDDFVDLPHGDFRRLRRYLGPWVFYPYDESVREWLPPTDLVDPERWGSIMNLPTDVALKSSSYAGSAVGRLEQLQSDWVFSWPDPDEAPFMEEAALLAGEEFDALVFNAIHGWYRQAIGCLRNALEVLATSSALAAAGEGDDFEAWRRGERQYGFGQCRAMLRDSKVGLEVDRDALPATVFGNDEDGWMKTLYGRLCAYAHSRPGFNNADFWESNGPVYREAALEVVEAELRETLALSYMLVRIAWPSYHPKQGQKQLLDGPQGDWSRYHSLLRRWLLS